MTNLDLAIDHYLDAERALAAARARSTVARLTGTARQAANANYDALAARQAHTQARDELVHAALATRITSTQETP